MKNMEIHYEIRNCAMVTLNNISDISKEDGKAYYLVCHLNTSYNLELQLKLIMKLNL